MIQASHSFFITLLTLQFHTTDFVALCDFCQLSVVVGKCVLWCDHTHQQR